MILGIESKNVLIVGASKGIGRAIAIGFAQEKANIEEAHKTGSRIYPDFKLAFLTKLEA